MSTALLILGLCALAATLLTTFRIQHPSQFGVIVFVVSWIVGELAMFHLALQVVATAILVALGALDDVTGIIGLGAMVVSWIGLVGVQRTAGRARDTLAAALEPTAPEAAQQVRAGDTPLSTLLRPFHFDRTGIERVTDIAYGPNDRNLLDIYRPSQPTAGGSPILVHVHGGAWISGDKTHQGLPLLHEAARRGWMGVAITYRVGPKARFPAAIDDVNAALQWVRDNGAEHGGDPSFVAVSGGSAGGHLSSLAALAPPPNGAGVEACVPIYATSDFTDHLGIRGYASLTKFLQRSVMSTALVDDAQGWDAASPIKLVTAEAPPFFVIQAANDAFVWREENRAYVEQLRSKSKAPVLYAELPGAQHAFDVFNSVRSLAAVDATMAFLEHVHASRPAPTT